MRSLKYLMMLTDEAFVIDPIATDLFAEMAARGALVASLQAGKTENCHVVPYLHARVAAYAAAPPGEASAAALARGGGIERVREWFSGAACAAPEAAAERATRVQDSFSNAAKFSPEWPVCAPDCQLNNRQLVCGWAELYATELFTQPAYEEFVRSIDLSDGLHQQNWREQAPKTVWARLAAPRAAVWEDAHASACGLRRAEDLGFGSPADSAKAAATAKGCEQFRDRVGGGVQGLNLTLLEALAIRFSPAASTDSLLTIKVPDAGRDQRDLTAHDEWIARTTGWTWPLGFSGANASTRDELAVAHRAGLMAGEALKYIVPPPARPNLAQVAVSTGVVDRALRVGGWLCYATLVETYLAARPRAFFVSADAAAKMRGWCGEAAARPDRLGTVLARMHNGLGNQMWIYAFGRALAESLGFRHAPSKLRVEEAPHADHLLPPNTDLGFAAFATAYPHLPLTPVPLLCGDGKGGPPAPGDALVLSDRAKDGVPLVRLLDKVIHRTFAPPTCLLTVGYFQNYALVQPIKERVKSWLRLNPAYIAATRAARAPLPGPNDVVTHIRWCGSKLDQTVGERLKLLYERVLPAMRYETLWTVMPLQCQKSAVFHMLETKYRGKMYPVPSSCQSAFKKQFLSSASGATAPSPLARAPFCVSRSPPPRSQLHGSGVVPSFGHTIYRGVAQVTRGATPCFAPPTHLICAARAGLQDDSVRKVDVLVLVRVAVQRDRDPRHAADRASVGHVLPGGLRRESIYLP